MPVNSSNEERIFNLARKLPDADARSDYLDQVCGEDRQAKAHIQALLTAHENQAFMDCGPAEAAATIDQPLVEAVGHVIGKYKLLQKIGEGGFGVVFMAEQQEPVRRSIALKIVKPGMDSREVIARFEVERQTLAMMNHPNIAQVFDGGITENGRPFFVMELVKGVPITEYCNKNCLSTSDRLKLFIDVCRAVQHAHQKGVIHRDLKPSNIMITLHDGGAVVKVIDFGVSKALHQRLTEKTLFTAYGQMVGTPQYMSPEQAEMSGLDVDTRCDVYSLGVLLYELLTGTTPLDVERLRGAGYAEIQRMIQEDEPLCPSVQLSTARDALAAMAVKHSVDPRTLRQFVAGELDWIVMRALEKERGRRYESASEFANDIQRFLNHENVSACPPSLRYRLSKVWRRNRLLLSSSATILTILLISTVISTIAAVNQKRAAERASHAEASAVAAKELANRRYKQSMTREMGAVRTARLSRYQEVVKDLVAKSLELEPNVEERRELRDLAVACMGDFAGQPPKEIETGLPFFGYFSSDVHPRSSWVAFGSKDGEVALMDYVTGARKTIRPPIESEFVRHAFDSSGRYLVCAHAHGMISVYDRANDWEILSTIPLNLDQKRIVAAVWISDDGKQVLVCEGWMQRVTRVDFLDNGEHRTRVITPKLTHAEERAHEDDNSPRYDAPAVFSQNGQLLALQDTPSTIVVWDLPKQMAIATLTLNDSDWETYPIFSGDGEQLAVAYGQGFEVFDLKRSASRLYIADEWITDVAFSPDNRRLAACNGQLNHITIWSIPRRRALATLRNEKNQGNSWALRAAFHETGRRLTIASERSIAVWDLTTDERVECPGSIMGVPCNSFTPDGAMLAAGSADRYVRLWNSSSGKLVKEIAGLVEPPESLAFSPDGRWLAVGDHTGFVYLYDWKISDQPLVRKRLFRKMYVWYLAFNPDSDVLAAASEDDWTAWKIDTENADAEGARSESSIALNEIPTDDIPYCMTVCFSPDGQYIVGARRGEDSWYELDIWNWHTRERLPVPTSTMAWAARCFAFDRSDAASTSVLFVGHDWEEQRSRIEQWKLPRDEGEEFECVRTFDTQPRQWTQMWSLRQPTGSSEGSSMIGLSNDGIWLSQAMGQAILIWNTNSKTDQYAFAIHEQLGLVWSITWHPTRNLLGVGTSAGSVAIWDLDKIAKNLDDWELSLED